jgi:hypothetical protein
VLDTIAARGLPEHVQQVGKEIATGIEALGTRSSPTSAEPG